jgi:TonB family protein
MRPAGKKTPARGCDRRVTAPAPRPVSAAGWAARVGAVLVMVSPGGCGHPPRAAVPPLPMLPPAEVSAGCGERPGQAGAGQEYFQTVKERVAPHWRPYDERRMDRTGTLYGDEDRYTALLVEVRRNGTLASMSVEVPSGVSLLDAMAVQAFAQTAPLPPPLPDLLQNGRLRFRIGFCYRPRGSP